MKENNEEKNLEVSGVIAKTEQYIKKNKKTLSIVGGAIVVVALAIWAYVALVAQPRQVRAAEDMFAAEQWFNEGDFEKALNGNDEFMGFAEVIDEYGCTKSGNLAKYYAGICQLNLGKYDEAIEYLKSYKGKDIFTSALSQMLAPIVGIPALLGNPHFQMTAFLGERIGTHEYKSPRKDGNQHFVIDEPLIQEFAELEATQFHYCNPLFKDKVWGLFGEQDTLAHFEPLFLEHYNLSFHFPGAHTPTAEEVRTWYVPLIEKMLLREH